MSSHSTLLLDHTSATEMGSKVVKSLVLLQVRGQHRVPTEVLSGGSEQPPISEHLIRLCVWNIDPMQRTLINKDSQKRRYPSAHGLAYLGNGDE